MKRANYRRLGFRERRRGYFRLANSALELRFRGLK